MKVSQRNFLVYLNLIVRKLFDFLNLAGFFYIEGLDIDFGGGAVVNALQSKTKFRAPRNFNQLQKVESELVVFIYEFTIQTLTQFGLHLM